jgi:hypothetical protein
MNDDHSKPSAYRVVRLAMITALFAIACGLPDSASTLLRVLQTLAVR